jgi:hypothetical protein
MQQNDHRATSIKQTAGVQSFLKVPFHVGHFAVLALAQPCFEAIAFFVQPAGLGDLAIQETQFQGQGLEALAAVAGSKVHKQYQRPKIRPVSLAVSLVL